jgi:hypothetical protein
MAARDPGSKALHELWALRRRYGPGLAELKLARLRVLARTRLRTPRAVERLHEALCFLRAYPDRSDVLAQVTRMLAAFARRRDLRRFAGALADSGIAGTALGYPFFQATAAELARRFPDRLELDWERLGDEQEELLLRRLDQLALYSETPGLDEADLPLRRWLDLMKRPDEAQGAFLARRFAALAVPDTLRESYYDELGLDLLLRPGPETPSRTRAHAPLAARRPVFQVRELRQERPDLRAALRRRPRVRALPPRAGAELLQLARDAMVVRSRDLDVFAYGDPRDVRLLECEGGLSFAAIGFRPERRLLLEAVYGFLTLQNGVPIGYVLNSALFGSAEIAYNVFETFRGAEAGHVYGWVLACVRHLFGVDSFTIYPYQLGHENEEGLKSGAWWFYQKLGFAPRAARARALMRRELARLRRRPGQRSTRATLARLAEHNLYYSPGRERRDVIGEVALSSVGLAVTRYLGRRFGSRREQGERLCAREAAALLGAGPGRGWSRGERLAWRRWAPLLLLVPGIARWSQAEKRAAAAVVRAKGGLRESDFVVLFDHHKKLRRGILTLSQRTP